MTSDVPRGVLAGSYFDPLDAPGLVLNSPFPGPPADHPASGPVATFVTTYAPWGYVRPDAFILDDVARHLAAHPDIEARDITVACDEGVVTVAGSVPSTGHKVRIEALVASTFGVRDVDLNQLEIDRGLEAPDSSALLAESEGTSHADLAVTAPVDDAAPKERPGRSAGSTSPRN